MQRLSLYFTQVVLLFLLLMMIGCDINVEEMPDKEANSDPIVYSTHTPKPTAAILEVEFGEEVLVEQYGFSYRSVSNYNMISQTNGISLIEHNTSSSNGPIFFLSRGDSQALSKKEEIKNVLITFANEDPLTNVLAHIADDLVPSEYSVIGSPSSVTINGLPGKQLDITLFGEEPVGGRITVLGETASQLFVMVGLSPLTRWNKEIMPLYNDLLDRVAFFDPIKNQ